MSEHSIKFERNQISGYLCATCSCGWSAVESTLTGIQLRASVHPNEWVEIDPLTGEEKQTTEAAA